MIKRVTSKLEDDFAWQLKAHGIPYRTEMRFHPTRKWRFDFVINERIAIEIEGGHFTHGRHVRGKGFEADCEKYNEAQLAGYIVLRGTSNHVKSGKLLAWVQKARSYHG